MKQLKYLFFLPISCVLIFLSSCGSSGVDALNSGNWIYLNNQFPGDQRNSAVSFVIGNTAYLGTGYSQARNIRYSDLYSFNPTSGWSQLASAPAGFTPRSNAVGFSVGTNGYVALGQDNNNNYLQDTWQYTPSTNTWTKKSNFGGSARIDATAFGIGTLGYVLCGYDGGSNRKDSWSYNPATDTWALTTVQFNGGKRTGAIVIVRANKAYIVTGTDNGTEVSDFIVFDPSSASPWTALRSICNCSSDTYDDDYTDIVRDHGVGFLVGDSAYITTGSNAGAYSSKTWGYDFVHDTWFRKTSFEKTARSNAVAFTLQNQAFITTGKSNSQDLDDLNQWFPYQDYNIND